EKRQRVVGHLLDTERSCKLTSAHPAIVEADALEPVCKRVGLRGPAVAVNADALNEQHRRASSAPVIRQLTRTRFDRSRFAMNSAHAISVGAVRAHRNHWTLEASDTSE